MRIPLKNVVKFDIVTVNKTGRKYVLEQTFCTTYIEDQIDGNDKVQHGGRRRSFSKVNGYEATTKKKNFVKNMKTLRQIL